jgi:quercetin dioxygenase-like cupin family protein
MVVAMLSALAWYAVAAGQKHGAGAAEGRAAPGKEGREKAAFTLTRFEEAEVQKQPWGWIRWLMNSKIDPEAEMTLGVVHIDPGQANPLHVHPNSAEYLHVLSGSCEHRVGGKWVALKAGDTIRIPKGAAHSARTGREPCRVLVVYDTGQRQMVPVPEGK